MKEAFTIKLYDGVKVITEDGVQTVKYLPDLWKMFKWDIENDPNAKECAGIITRELICYGRMNLSAMNHGRLLHLVLIPAQDETKGETK